MQARIYAQKSKLKEEEKPRRQAIEVSIKHLTKQLGIRNSFLVATLHKPIINLVPHIIVTEAPKAPRRRRALTNSFSQIHSISSLLVR